MVSPPPDVGNKPAPAAASRPAAATLERGPAPPGAAAPAPDRADIKPLDVQAALQILIAEVRESFALLLIEAGGAAVPVDDGGGDGGGGGGAAGAGAGGFTPGAAVAGSVVVPANLDSEAVAARALVESVLQSLPDSLDESAWSAALPRVEAALQSGVQAAVDVVSAWRGVSSLVVETTKASGQLALRVLDDGPQNPLWLRPEWLAMAPRLTRFWRRRRAHRRRLTDPDHDTATAWDETDDYAQ